MELKPDQTRLLALAAPTILEMLSTKETMVLNKLYAKFRSGETDFLAIIAEYSVIRDQIQEIKTTLSTEGEH